jgi:hypothetical protein
LNRFAGIPETPQIYFEAMIPTAKREAKTQTLGAEAVNGLNPQHPKNEG